MSVLHSQEVKQVEAVAAAQRIAQESKEKRDKAASYQINALIKQLSETEEKPAFTSAIREKYTEKRAAFDVLSLKQYREDPDGTNPRLDEASIAMRDEGFTHANFNGSDIAALRAVLIYFSKKEGHEDTAQSVIDRDAAVAAIKEKIAATDGIERAAVEARLDRLVIAESALNQKSSEVAAVR